MRNAIDTIYTHRNKFIIIGLTGKIGSGCTTSVDFLAKTIDEHKLPEITLTDTMVDSQRKQYIIDKFYRKNWVPFYKITVSDVIASFVFENRFEELNRYIESKNLRKLPRKLKDRYNDFHEHTIKILKKIRKNKWRSGKSNKTIKELFDYITKELPEFSYQLKKELIENNGSYRFYTKLYQKIGNNIRLTGEFNKETDGNAKNIYTISDRVNDFIKILRHYNNLNNKPTYIVIDAFRNPFEIMFFRERYSAFYLMSINADDDDIRDRLVKLKGMTNDEIEEQEEYENTGDSLSSLDEFISQNIHECIQKSDIHVHNSGKVTDSPNYRELYGQLIKYISLIKHPGLITPSNDEKMMQIAYTAKLNSGCISRQVGAVVTNKNGSVKSIGWNSVPEGQTPCLLRSTKELVYGSDSLSYSSYEKSDFFKRNLSKFSPLLPDKRLKGKNQTFCFKSIYNKIKNDKNQVHTRSLHAEENAFLQIAKYGGEGVKGGTLYSTASPCELCSKKAYQLGITRIVYIDPYPGIARKQILLSGQTPPKMNLFKGAIGVAYHKLYEPILPFKDELDALRPENDQGRG